MSQLQKCFKRSEMNEYLNGSLSDEQSSSLESHLLECDLCASTINGLIDQDTVDSFIQAKHSDDTEAEQLVKKITHRLHAQRTEKGKHLETLDEDSQSASFNEFLQFLSPAEQSGEIGRLGGYRVLRVLGAGGMGVVFEAEDLDLDRKVALKVMKRNAAENESAKLRFLREAKMTAALNHDHVVTVYQVGEENGVPFLAMELLDGEPLDDRLANEQLPVAEVLRIARETASGLAEAHNKDLIHRDMKPSNLWLCSMPRDRVKILDFGLAQITRNEDEKLTRSGMILGTPAYMSPEQTQGEQADARSDLFSLGCVMYQMLTGHKPFKGRDLISTLLAVASAEPESIHEYNPDVPSELVELVRALLQKEPTQRPSSAQEVVDRITAIENDLSTVGTEILPIPNPKPTHSSRKYVLAGVVLLALLGITILFGSTIFRFMTNQGVLVIEVNDPNIEVVVKMDSVVVHEKTNKREFVLDAKEGQVEVFEKDGIGPLLTKQFTLNRGGKTIVKVTLKELANATPNVEKGNYALNFENGETIVDCKSLVLDRTKPHTLEAWVKMKEFGNILSLIEPQTPRFHIGPKGGDFWGNHVRKRPHVLFGEAMEDWVHLAGVQDETEARLYVNGKLMATAPMRIAKAGNGKGLRLGGWTVKRRGAFKGQIDEVRISSFARYTEDFTPKPRLVTDNQTLLLYHFDQGEGDPKDSSGNGHHAKNMGAKWVKSDRKP